MGLIYAGTLTKRNTFRLLMNLSSSLNTFVFYLVPYVFYVLGFYPHTFTSHTYVLLMSIFLRKHWWRSNVSWTIPSFVSTEKEISWVSSIGFGLKFTFCSYEPEFQSVVLVCLKFKEMSFPIETHIPLLMLCVGCVKCDHEYKCYHPPLAYFLHCVWLVFLKPYCPITIFEDVSYIILKFCLSCYCKAGCDRLFLS